MARGSKALRWASNVFRRQKSLLLVRKSPVFYLLLITIASIYGAIKRWCDLMPFYTHEPLKASTLQTKHRATTKMSFKIHIL